MQNMGIYKSMGYEVFRLRKMEYLLKYRTYPILYEKNWLKNTGVLFTPDMAKDKIDPRSVMK